MRQRVPTALSVTALLVALLGATPYGEAASEAVLATFAQNANKLRGFAPAKTAKKNTVVVRGQNGKIGRASLPAGLRGERGLRGPAGPVGATGAAGAKGDTGDPGNNSLVAFANVAGEDPTPSIRSFGGQGTTGASVTKCATGCFDIVFTGTYRPRAASRDQLSTFATVDMNTFDFAATSLPATEDPTTSQISVRVFTISAASILSAGDIPALVDRDFAVQVLLP